MHAMLENKEIFCFHEKTMLSACAEKKAVSKQFITLALNMNKSGFISVILPLRKCNTYRHNLKQVI